MFRLLGQNNCQQQQTQLTDPVQWLKEATPLKLTFTKIQ